MVASGAMTSSSAVADVSSKELGEDQFTVLVAGVPVGRIVYSFGAANGVPEGSAVTEEALTAIAEAWFSANAP
jgi:hypothetical protein